LKPGLEVFLRLATLKRVVLKLGGAFLRIPGVWQAQTKQR
jgi:hypothetical protein